MSAVPVKVHPMRKSQTEPHPYASCKGPTARRPMEAVIAPHPLIRPVTVPSDLLFPRTDGCDARSAATAEVMMLFGLSRRIEREGCVSKLHSTTRQCMKQEKTYPPTRMPIMANITRRATALSSSDF